ncbi:MAG: TIGR01777 family protein [Euryarchaeota archaeon]|nr:TIGR01777 family protein [Euryarchaeota archaeon]MCH2640929.1 TIGR01777 family oxidoreductase [Candidatus Thalassarchaeum sp.]
MKYEYETHTDSPRPEVFDWFERKGSFRRLMPPWEVAEEVRADETLEDGAQRIFRFPMGPIKMTWVAEHLGYQPPEKFEDIMKKGPFRSWHHVHRFIEKDGGTVVHDEVDYKLPMGVLGRIFGSRNVRNRLNRMFRARENRLIRDLERHSDFKHLDRKRILLAGASGLIGKQLAAFLDTGGHEIWRLVRRTPVAGQNEIEWDPSKGTIDNSAIEGFDIVIHLGGAGIGDRRWTKSRMVLIEKSRTESTGLLARTLASLKQKPEVFLVASAIGWYGNRGDEILDEQSEAGTGFLPETCLAWEASADAARQAGIRTIHARTGVVLDASGGALEKMLLPAKMGAGGPIGFGRQWFSWISMDDQIYALHHLVMSPNTEGAYNITSPEPLQQKNFAKALGRVLRRPAFMPTPPFAIWFLYGKMGVALTTESQRVMPTRLTEEGYRFQHQDAESALRDALGKWKN